MSVESLINNPVIMALLSQEVNENAQTIVSNEVYANYLQVKYPGIRGSDYELVNQTTSITNPVSSSAKAYIFINTETATLAPGASAKFVLTNSLITANPYTTIIKATVIHYGGTFGTNGIPIASVGVITEGGCEIVICNAGTTALNSFCRIYVELIQPVSSS